MKDPAHELILALYTALNGNVTYSATAIPIYSLPVSWEDRPADQYVRIGEVKYDMDGSPKDGNISEGTVEIWVETFFIGKDVGSKVPMNDIANTIGGLIDQSFTLTSFTQVLGRISGMEELDYELDPAGVVFQKLITYSFIIEQN